MSEQKHANVNAQLQAYHDGELKDWQREQVEAHLADCQTCQAELAELQALSSLLFTDPAATFPTSPEQFVAQIGLRLPRRPAQSAWQRSRQAVWYAIPAALTLGGIFARTSILVNNMLAGFGWLSPQGSGLATVLGEMQAAKPVQVPFALPQLGFSEWLSFSWDNLTSGTILDTAALTYTVAVPVIIGLLALGWLAGWWVLQTHKNGNRDTE